MKKKSAFFALIILVFSCFTFVSCLSTLESLAGSYGATPQKEAITNADAIAAMKDALKEGIASASGKLSVTDGYFGDALLRIMLPPEAKPILDSVGKIPQGQKYIDDVVLRLNRSAEEAAKDVVPIFVDAITTMTVADGFAIIKGHDRSATKYLEAKTRQSLLELYRPKVEATLAKPLLMNVSAKKSWETLSISYNKVGQVANVAASLAGKNPPMPPVEVDLATYATNRALDGLFLKIGEEEQKIRSNPLAYASSMIKKVFGALKNGLL